jgi:hypothetical protein
MKAATKYPMAKAAHSFMVNKAAKAHATLCATDMNANTADKIAAMMVGSFISISFCCSGIATVIILYCR